MGKSARVTSIEAIEDFKVAFIRFRTDAAKALGSVEQELRRILDALEERARYWQRQVRERQEELVQAKNEYIRRKMMKEDGRGPGYTEQEEAYEEAQRRLKEAEDKVERCRRWNNQVPHAVLEYEGPARQLNGMLDTEVRQAIVLLEKKVSALEAYILLDVPPGATAPEQTSTPAAPVEQSSQSEG